MPSDQASGPLISPWCSFLTWLDCSHCCSVALQRRLEDWETMGQIHSASHRPSYRAQQSSNTGSNYSFLSSSQPFHGFFIFYQWSPRRHCRLSELSHVWHDGWESATHHEMHEMPKCVYVWMMCEWASWIPRGCQAMEPDKGCSWPAHWDAT